MGSDWQFKPAIKPCFMEFTIATREKEEVPYFLMHALPDHQFLIPDARGIQASGNFGSMQFYEIDCRDFSIWYNNYQIAERTFMYGMMNAPMLELHFIIDNTVQFKLEGLRQMTMRQGQFNLTYAPFVNNITWFHRRATYSTFDIHFTFEYLEKLVNYFPRIGKFLEKVQSGIATRLGKHHGSVTAEMSALIRRIIRCDLGGNLRDLYLQTKVQELLILALQQLAMQKPLPPDVLLRPVDHDKIREAHDYLLRNMDDDFNLVSLCHRFGINDYKLKKGFKKLYGTSVYDFLIEMRLEKARELLLDTDNTIQDIAFETGYKNVSGFITAFRKKTGFSPGVYKKMRKGWISKNF